MAEIGTWIALITRLFSKLTVALPPQMWWFPVVILAILGLTAAVDAVKGRVPDAPVFAGLLLTFVTLGLFRNWAIAAEHIGFGFMAALVLWGINELYYKWQQNDAIGLGDAKWTALAVAAFSVKPVLWAWIVGAWLGVLWLVGAWILGLAFRVLLIKADLKPKHVHFAPFLYIGLWIGLYWHHLR